MTDRQLISLIAKKLDAIAKKGKDNIFEFYKYIDELISKSQYSYFESALFDHYGIDISNKNILSVRQKVWKDILFQTNSVFSVNLKKLYDRRGVYQVGSNIYTTSESSQSILLGQINEFDEFIQDSKFLYENPDFIQLMGLKKTYLTITKVIKTAYPSTPRPNEVSTIRTENTSLSSSQNLLIRYSLALDILLSADFVTTTGYWDDLGHWDDNGYWID